MTLSGVLENVIANFISAALVGGIAYLLLYLRMSGVLQKIRRLIHPDGRVFFLEGNAIEKIQKTQHSPFHSPISNIERDYLIEFYDKRNGTKPHNNLCVRLDSVTKCEKGFVLQISLVHSFDFITTNWTVYPANIPIRSFRNQLATVLHSIRLFTVMDKVVSEVKKYGSPRKVEDVLQNNTLANIAAVSILIVDKKGKIGIVKRTKNTAVSLGSYGMACTGTVTKADFDTEDPFLSCVRRNLEEKCNLSLAQAEFDGIVVPIEKMQPVLLFHVQLEHTWEEHYPKMSQAKDYTIETDSLYAVPLEHSVRFATQTRMTDTAAYQIKKYAKNKGHTSSWYLDMIKLMRKKKYLCSSQDTNQTTGRQKRM